MTARVVAATVVGAVAFATSMVGAASSASTAAAASGSVQSIVTGSWWQGQQAGGVVPPPPNVPPKGLWVESQTSGATAVSALRFTLVGATAPMLHLVVKSAQPASQVSILACPTKSDWKPATAGPWSAKPSADCSQVHAAGQLSPDGTTMTFDLSPFPIDQAGNIDVLFQPGDSNVPVAAPPVGAAAPAPTFDATFQPVEAAQIVVTPSSPAPASDASTQSDSLASPAPAFSTPANVDAPLSAPIGSGVAEGFTPPPTSPSLPSSAPIAAPSPPASIALGASAKPSRPASSKTKGLTRRERLLIATLVLDFAFYAMYQGYLSPSGLSHRLTIYDDPKFLPRPAPAEVRPARVPALR